jgi:probable lipoprotein NlpC
MKLKPYLHNILLLLTATIILSACHSKKAILKGEPGEVVKPQGFIADKYAEIMNVDKSNIQNGRLYAFIDQWMGVPYKFGGQDKDGVDCSGLAQLLEQEVFNINIPRTTGQQVTTIKRKYEEELQEGDLVFFNFDGKQFSHVGVYLQNGYVVHASSRRGVMIVRLKDPSLYKYFSRAGSVNGLVSSQVGPSNP